MTRRKKLLWSTVFLVVALVSPALALGNTNSWQDQTSDEAVTLNNRAVAHAQSGRYQEAIDLLTEAISQRPDFAMAHYNLGLALWSTGEKKYAEENLRKANRLDPRLKLPKFLAAVE